MCIAYFAWQAKTLEDLLLLTLFNRDEQLDRPTAHSHFWDGEPGILGGRDLVAGGTWMCINTRTGRAAFLTNFRELHEPPFASGASTADEQEPNHALGTMDSFRLGTPSRGELAVDFVRGTEDPGHYLLRLQSGRPHAGFNLVVVELQHQRMAYLCNRGSGQQPQVVPPGFHSITNGHLDEHCWPKMDEGQRQLQSLLERGAFGTDSGEGGGGSGSSIPWQQLFELLSDDRQLETNPAKLPQTGLGDEFEAAASGIFVKPIQTKQGLFGTRSQAVLAVWRDGRGVLRERYRDSKSGEWREVQHSFKVPIGAG